MGLGHCCDFLLADPFPSPVLPKVSVPVLAALVIQGWFEELTGRDIWVEQVRLKNCWCKPTVCVWTMPDRRLTPGREL
jgi:hypothetical protein